MLYRSLLIAMFLCISAIFIDVSHSQSEENLQYSLAYQNCPNCKYVHVWIDGVRWMFVYAEDGSLINNYPDPEY